ncbi:hypothetical protein Ahy_B02g060275 [Arachis hypogaea]|uniref:Aminotransferase-like plant mobile domain-containing protein n=1 Tax=Arachis hypogaea TaxID=3818 RepID=A0A445AI40_ARAHY|nr:hypothetical protein Ahy_B02g060275 [Arachis hypogaea]
MVVATSYRARASRYSVVNQKSVVRRIRDVELLDTEESIRRYVRCQIFYLLGSTLFTDKSTAYAYAKYLSLVRDFERIQTYSWGSVCLSHLYRALYRASRYDTKKMDGPLNLLHGSECPVLRPYRDRPFHRLRYQLL